MNLLHHEVLKSSLLGCFSVPLDFRQFFFDLFTVNVKELNITAAKPSDLQIVDVINITRIFEDGRHVAGQIGLTIIDTDDHRAVLACSINLLGLVIKKDGQRITAADARHGARQRFNRIVIAFQIV